MYTFHDTRRHLPQARSQFKSRSTANNVSILVPVPSDADSPKFKTSTGSTKWIPEKNVVQWNIKSFPVSTNKIPLNLFNPFGLTYMYFLLLCPWMTFVFVCPSHEAPGRFPINYNFTATLCSSLILLILIFSICQPLRI